MWVVCPACDEPTVVVWVQTMDVRQGNAHEYEVTCAMCVHMFVMGVRIVGFKPTVQ